MGTRIALVAEVEDVEAVVVKAVAGGAVSEGEVAEVENAYHDGGRVGTVKDPYNFV